MIEARPADQDARKRIEQDLDHTLFVEAGAGTGKTRQLIERILQLIVTGRTELRHIAAITFTEAAAAELRDRVRERLEQAAAALDGEERDRCRTALTQVDITAIETLHGFAQRILTNHPLEAGLPPFVEVQDEIQASVAFDERWTAMFDALLANPELEQPLLRAFVLGMNEPELRQLALVFHENWDRLEDCEIPFVPAPPVDTSEIESLLAGAIAQRGQCSDESDQLYEFLAGLEPYVRRLCAAEDGFDKMRILAESRPISIGKGKQENWHGVKPADIRSDLTRASNLRKEILKEQRAAVLSPILSSIRQLVLDYAIDRRRQGRLEFHDLLVQARDLLRKDASVRRAVRDQFTHLLIDEFQDTDPLQIEIAVLIAQPFTDGAPAGWQDAQIEEGRLFFVGDPKQSIYRFRRADIALYTRAQERLHDRTVHLTQNFRSVRPVIDWVNHVFAALMRREGLDVEDPYAHEQADFVPLEPSREADPGPPAVRVIGAPQDGNVVEIRAAEAKEIARAIQAAKADAWPVVETDAEGARTARPARYADIALLLPTRTTLPPIEEALEDAGIPYRVESQSLVYDTQEVRDLLAVLRALDDPTDQVALIAALRAPAFACSDDALLRWKNARGRWDFRSRRPDAIAEDDAVAQAMAALRDLHERRWWEPISGIVEAVIRERRLFELAFSYRRPRERWQRLRFVLDQSRAFAEAGGRTLRQFIEWAERQAQEGTRVVETVVPDRDDDAVRIMTVHAAKGLEFPIVILAGLNLETGSSRRDRVTVLWEGNVPELRSGDFETAQFERLWEREKWMEAQEKVRLLYVAATRARDHLVVSLHHKAGKTLNSHAARLTPLCTGAPELVQYLTFDADRRIEEPPHKETFNDSPERLAAWQAAREERIATNARVPVVAATEIARGAGAASDPNLQKEPPVEEVPPWRRGRAGTAVGRAVHAVLQSIDLATGEGVDGAARAQAAAEGIPNRADAVARMVRAALASGTVREAVGGRYWRELYVAAPVDGKGVEGFVDLLYETPEGLVVVDYKTDAVPEDEALEEAAQRYRLQGAAYALALEQALQRKVARCVFLFVQPAEAAEREIADLREAIEEARDAVVALEYAGVERDAGPPDEVDDHGVDQVGPLEVERVAEPGKDAQLGLWDQVGEDR